MPMTKKTAMQSENLKKAEPELNRINKKYENKTDQESQIQKSQETLMVYKKYDINPASSCLFAFIQIPLLFYHIFIILLLLFNCPYIKLYHYFNLHISIFLYILFIYSTLLLYYTIFTYLKITLDIVCHIFLYNYFIYFKLI